jgi:hypothetical protein
MKFNQFVLEIHLFLFLFFIIGAFVAGYLLNRAQLFKLNTKVYDAEKDLTNANIEIVEYIEVNKKLTEEIEKIKKGTPVVKSSEDEKVKEIRLGKIG